jgi:sugar transferase (PEP-CTERM/EpsH1 system associated)
MNVLFACHRVPFPPKRGGKIRPFNIIRHLTDSGHSVTVASLARNEAEAAEAAGLKDHCAEVLLEVIPDASAWARMLAWVPTTRPSSFAYFHSPRLMRRVAERLSSGTFDLAFAHCSSAAPYLAGARGMTRILDYGDMDSQKWREYARYQRFPLSAGYQLETVKLERTERLLSQNVDLCTATTRGELESLRALGVTTTSDWFPNGVDAQFFAPDATAYDSNLICFVGRMDYFPNQQAVTTFCDSILPEIQKGLPAARFCIVGADPTPAIRKLGERPGVSVTGSVPDVRPHVRRAALTVAPLEIARGTQNKILESMALGVPVICSPQASGGVDAIPGQHLLVAGSLPEWVASVSRLLTDSAQRAALASAGRERVLSHHSWSASMRRLDTLIASARERTAATAGLAVPRPHSPMLQDKPS